MRLLLNNHTAACGSHAAVFLTDIPMETSVLVTSAMMWYNIYKQMDGSDGRAGKHSH